MIRTFVSTTAMIAATAGAILAGTGVAAAAVAPAASVHPAAVAPATPCTTATIIQVNSFAFHPGTVVPGQTSAATLVSTNCTAVSLATEQTWLGQWISASGTGLPSGCPVIDPLARSVDYAPGEQVTESTGYLVPTGCKANALKVTVRITGSGGAQLAQASAVLTILQPTSGS